MRNKIRVILSLSILIIALLSSCTSTRSVEVVKKEYLPVKLDLQDSVDRLYETRPELEPSLEDTSSLTVLLVAYKDFGEEWMDYSFRLEDYINNLVEALKPEE